MIVGETQVLGQVKDAYQKAQEYKASDSVLNSLFQKAIHVGKKVRTATAIDQHPVSVSYAAVELARAKMAEERRRKAEQAEAERLAKVVPMPKTVAA